MADQYAVQQLQHREFSKEFPFAQNVILDAGYKYWLESAHGPYQIEKPGFSKCAMCYSIYFNSAATALLRATREMNPSADVREVIEHVRNSKTVFPNQEDMETEAFLETLLKLLRPETAHSNPNPNQ